MILTPSQMKAVEEAAFLEGATPEGLMESAGEGIARVVGEFFPRGGTIVVYCGKGHNGGDALLAAHRLVSAGWQVFIRLVSPVEELAALTCAHLEKLPPTALLRSLPGNITGPLILLDGLLGIGSEGHPRGTTAELIREMNSFRNQKGGFSIAVDLPSGLDGTTGEVFDPCVQADLTVTLGMVKSGLMADRATSVVGRLALVPLPGLSLPEESGDRAKVITADFLRSSLPIRDFDSYKGTYGRIGIIAGSRGYLGAARLASSSAVHAGGGLVTLYALAENYELLASCCVPEVMVHPVDSYLDILSDAHDVLAIGPGLGDSHDDDLRKIVSEATIPCVVDAEALNAISKEPALLNSCAAPRLLTPHPGEMERLNPRDGRTRWEWAEGFTAEYPVTLLLKGARTIIAEKGRETVFNTTGNPGMGSGGMGDVLTGVCAALIGSGHHLRDAAMLGAWLCGRAAEIAIFNGNDSQESLSASSVISHLGAACDALRRDDY
ncbi:MAG: NAD(P)H-hydrate dehydratase [bacterium]